MSKEDKKTLSEIESHLKGWQDKADNDAANARLDSIGSELSNINFTLIEIRNILKKYWQFRTD